MTRRELMHTEESKRMDPEEGAHGVTNHVAEGAHDSAGADLVTHRGACHCGAVAFEVDAPAQLTALECNCSICRMTGFLHLIVSRSRFRLVRGDSELSEYRFNTGTARHLFCRHCGVKAFYVPRSNPDGYSVNVRCLERATIASIAVERFDDNDRAGSDARVRGLSRD